MKKTALFIILICILCLAACKSDVAQEEVTLFPSVSTESETTKKAAVKVNDTYDEVLFDVTNHSGKVDVIDDSVDYRTPDSYEFEQQATDEAMRLLYKEAEKYSDIEITGINVFDCIDDCENVYYSFCIRYSYTVESGGRIDNTFYTDIGIKKEDKEIFDSSSKMYGLINEYSIFVEKTDDNGYDVVRSDGKSDSIIASVEEFVAKHFKNPDKSRIFSVSLTDGNFKDGKFEVVCAGTNSYDLEIKDSIEVTVLYEKDTKLLTLSF